MVGQQTAGNPSTGMLALAAQHLNISIGDIVKPEHIAQALRGGSTRSLRDPEVNSAVAWLFVELAPHVINECASEAGASPHLANQLYRETLANDLPRALLWEKSVGALHDR